MLEIPALDVGPIRGRSFFPGGTGRADSSDGDSARPDLLVVGNDFGRYDEDYAAAVKRGYELEAGTWSGILKLLRDAKVATERCFFTNAVMGARSSKIIQESHPRLRTVALLPAAQSFFACKYPSCGQSASSWPVRTKHRSLAPHSLNLLNLGGAKVGVRLTRAESSFTTASSFRNVPRFVTEHSCIRCIARETWRSTDVAFEILRPTPRKFRCFDCCRAVGRLIALPVFVDSQRHFERSDSGEVVVAPWFGGLGSARADWVAACGGWRAAREEKQERGTGGGAFTRLGSPGLRKMKPDEG